MSQSKGLGGVIQRDGRDTMAEGKKISPIGGLNVYREKAASRIFYCRFFYNWSGCRDLNPGPSAPKADALPNCATPRVL